MMWFLGALVATVILALIHQSNEHQRFLASKDAQETADE